MKIKKKAVKESMPYTGRSPEPRLSESWMAGSRDIEHQALELCRGWLALDNRKDGSDGVYTIAMPLNALGVQTMDSSRDHKLCSSSNSLYCCFTEQRKEKSNSETKQ